MRSFVSDNLSSGEVHVWCADLDALTPANESFSHILARDETQRAARFRFARDRDRYLSRRICLRRVLSHYCEVSPETLRFDYGPQGKPSLRDFGHVRFNTSHSNGLAMYAFACDREVGVDLERKRPGLEKERVEVFFSLQEAEALQSLPVSFRNEGFFLCWTRKEAFIKATGFGISYGLDQFDVALVPGEPAAVLRIRGNSEEARQWQLIDIKVREPFVAAIAVKGQPPKLRFMPDLPLEGLLALASALPNKVR